MSVGDGEVVAELYYGSGVGDSSMYPIYLYTFQQLGSITTKTPSPSTSEDGVFWKRTHTQVEAVMDIDKYCVSHSGMRMLVHTENYRLPSAYSYLHFHKG